MVRKAAYLLVGLLVLAVGQVPANAEDGAHRVREVVGGDLAPQGKFPWVVRLSMGCGGTLIAPRVVLTAGHCVDGTGKDTGIRVIGGVVDLKSAKAQTARSVAVIRAAGFTNETRGDDWAVIRLDRALDLPTLPLGTAEKGTFTVMGWGQTRETALKQQRKLRYAAVPTVSDAECAKAYAKAGVDVVTGESICAGKNGVDTCQGDSGGPMVRRTGGGWEQVGIVSWGLGCARPGYPGVYTQISAFRDDIRKAAAKLSGS